MKTWLFALHQWEGGNTYRDPDTAKWVQHGQHRAMGALEGQGSLKVDSQAGTKGTSTPGPQVTSHSLSLNQLQPGPLDTEQSLPP